MPNINTAPPIIFNAAPASAASRISRASPRRAHIFEEEEAVVTFKPTTEVVTGAQI